MRLYLIEILHQTTTNPHKTGFINRCILLKFYIKPQPACDRIAFASVVSYWNSTSNHNILPDACYEILVVSYWNSTSNHNIRQGYINGLRLYLIEILHQTTTEVWEIRRRLELYLIEILHQTTTLTYCYSLSSSCILLKFYIKPQLMKFSKISENGCILLKFYIKPQRRGCYLFDFSALCRFVRPENWMQNLRRSVFDALFCISKNKDTVFSEKFQLLRHVRFCPFALAPEVENVSILFVCHRQNTRKSSRRHRPSNAIDVNLHVFFRGTMPDIHRILHHCEAVLFQRFAELCRMTPFCFGIGRQIEKDKQPHDPIGIQSRFWHGSIPTWDMIPFFVYQRSILLWKRL